MVGRQIGLELQFVATPIVFGRNRIAQCATLQGGLGNAHESALHKHGILTPDGGGHFGPKVIGDGQTILEDVGAADRSRQTNIDFTWPHRVLCVEHHIAVAAVSGLHLRAVFLSLRRQGHSGRKGSKQNQLFCFHIF